MAEQRELRQPNLEETVAYRPQRQMTMEDFWRPVIQDEYCKTPTLLNVIMIVVELIRGPMIEARVD